MSRLRVASYNIRLGLEQGLDAVAEVLQRLDADVVALQEIGRRWTMGVDVDQVETLARKTGFEFYAFCPTLVRNGHQLFGHALLSKAELSELCPLDLPRQRDEARRLLRSSLAYNGVRVTILSLHLSHLDDERPAQVECLSREIASIEGPLVVVGDLNEPRPERLESMFRAHGLEDCGAAEGDNTFPASDPQERRDLVAIRGFTIGQPVEVLQSKASDHLPLVVELL